MTKKITIDTWWPSTIRAYSDRSTSASARQPPSSRSRPRGEGAWIDLIARRYDLDSSYFAFAVVTSIEFRKDSTPWLE